MLLKNLMMAGVAVVFLQSLIACSPNKSPPDEHEVRRFIEVTLFRQAAMPVKNINIKDSRLLERSGITFHCVNWDAELVWDYPKGNNKDKVYGYVKYVKTPQGWTADHVNYKQAPKDPKLECETIPLSTVRQKKTLSRFHLARMQTTTPIANESIARMCA